MCNQQIIIVEGRKDKLQLQPLVSKNVEIICTNGTISPSRLEELVAPYENGELYAFFDEDLSGIRLRKLFTQCYPEATHLHTQTTYGQVQATPRRLLAQILIKANFAVNKHYLIS